MGTMYMFLFVYTSQKTRLFACQISSLKNR